MTANSRPLPDPPRPAATLADRAEIGVTRSASAHRSVPHHTRREQPVRVAPNAGSIAPAKAHDGSQCLLYAARSAPRLGARCVAAADRRCPCNEPIVVVRALPGSTARPNDTAGTFGSEGFPAVPGRAMAGEVRGESEKKREPRSPRSPVVRHAQLSPRSLQGMATRDARRRPKQAFERRQARCPRLRTADCELNPHGPSPVLTCGFTPLVGVQIGVGGPTPHRTTRAGPSPAPFERWFIAA